MNSRISRLVLVLTIVTVGFLSAFYIVRSSGSSAQLAIEVAPSGSSMKLNGRGVRGGVSKVKPGKYKVTFSYKGFSTVSKDLELAKGDNRYVGVALVSDSPSTANWYQKHPADAKKSEAISSKSFDQSSTDLGINNPIIRHLPLGYNQQEFAIDYKQADNDPTRIVLLITGKTPKSHQYALKQIREWGFDPTDYEIVFSDFVNPFEARD